MCTTHDQIRRFFSIPSPPPSHDFLNLVCSPSPLFTRHNNAGKKPRPALPPSLPLPPSLGFEKTVNDSNTTRTVETTPFLTYDHMNKPYFAQERSTPVSRCPSSVIFKIRFSAVSSPSSTHPSKQYQY